MGEVQDLGAVMLSTLPHDEQVAIRQEAEKLNSLTLNDLKGFVSTVEKVKTTE